MVEILSDVPSSLGSNLDSNERTYSLMSLSSQFKSFLYGLGGALVVLAIWLLFLSHLWEDHLLVDSIRANIIRNQQGNVVPPPSTLKETPKNEEVPKK